MILLKLKPVLEFERNVRYIYVLKRIYLYIPYNRRHLTNQWLISLGCATLELAQFSTLLIFIYLSLVSMINLPPPIWLPPSFIAFTSHLSLPHVVPSGPLPLTFISLSALSDPNTVLTANSNTNPVDTLPSPMTNSNTNPADTLL